MRDQIEDPDEARLENVMALSRRAKALREGGDG